MVQAYNPSYSGSHLRKTEDPSPVLFTAEKFKVNLGYMRLSLSINQLSNQPENRKRSLTTFIFLLGQDLTMAVVDLGIVL